MSDRCGVCGARWNMGDNQWIAVKDRLPELDERVLAVDRDGDINVAFRADGWSDHIIWTYYDYMEWHDVVAWMPLPSPPKEE